MKYKGTLELFDELVKSGMPESTARVMANQQGEQHNAMENIDNTLMKIEKDLFWMRVIGAAMTVAFLSNGCKVFFS